MRRAVTWAMASLLVCMPVVAVQVTVSDEDMAKCGEEGGCVLVTKQAVKRLLDSAFSAGVAQCKTDYRNRT